MDNHPDQAATEFFGQNHRIYPDGALNWKPKKEKQPNIYFKE
jgi:hypothetical protein